MSNEDYVNPFFEESEIYAQKLDDSTSVKDIDQLGVLLDEIESVLPDVVAQARLYYSIGTVYSDFAKTKGVSYEESLKTPLTAMYILLLPENHR